MTEAPRRPASVFSPRMQASTLRSQTFTHAHPLGDACASRLATSHWQRMMRRTVVTELIATRVKSTRPNQGPRRSCADR
eukprot:4601776-Pleurochrysis_carterae.AAC.3